MDNLVQPDNSSITKETLGRHLPKGTSHQVTDELLGLIYRMEDDLSVDQKDMEYELLANINIVKEMKVDLDDYVNALRYVIAKRNMSNRKAWELVFPDRLARAEAKVKREQAKADAGEKYNQVNIDSMVSAVNSSKVVTKLDSQIMIATHIRYAPMFHAAVKKQFDLMNGKASPNADGEQMTVSPHVQHLAAKELAEITKAPEEAKLEIDLNVNNSSVSGYMEIIAKTAEAQLAQLQSGKPLKEVQQLGIKMNPDIIDVETSND